MLYGAIIGDIVGSRFEWHNVKKKDFKLFTIDCFPTFTFNISLQIIKIIGNCEKQLPTTLFAKS